MFWKKIDGINMFKLNRTFKRLATSKITMQKQIRNNILTVYLPTKQVREITSQELKQRLLDNIKKLDGYESFKVTLLEETHLIYREHPTKTGVLRWLEIPISNDVHYDL